MSDQRFLDAAALEARYSSNRAAFPRWQQRYGFPAPRYLGHRRLWLLSELEAWEARQLKDSPGEIPGLKPFGSEATP